MSSEEFKNIKDSSIPGKNFTLICRDGDLQVHLFILYSKSELVYTAFLYETPQSLEIPFTKNDVEKCMMVFYGECNEQYTPNMYDIFLFLASGSKYLDLSLYEIDRYSAAIEYKSALEKKHIKFIKNITCDIKYSTKLLKDEYEDKFCRCVKKLSQRQYSIPRIRDNDGFVFTEVINLEFATSNRLSTILSLSLTPEEYNEEVQVVVDFILSECGKRGELGLLLINFLSSSFYLYGIGTKDFYYPCMKTLYYNYLGSGTICFYRTKNRKSYSKCIDYTILCDIPGNDSSSTERRTIIPSNLVEDAIEKLMELSCVYDWLTCAYSVAYKDRDGNTITQEEYDSLLDFYRKC